MSPAALLHVGSVMFAACAQRILFKNTNTLAGRLQCNTVLFLRIENSNTRTQNRERANRLLPAVARHNSPTLLYSGSFTCFATEPLVCKQDQEPPTVKESTCNSNAELNTWGSGWGGGDLPLYIRNVDLACPVRRETLWLTRELVRLLYQYQILNVGFVSCAPSPVWLISSRATTLDGATYPDFGSKLLGTVAPLKLKGLLIGCFEQNC